MSLKLGNTNIAGTQILYSTTGNNTDGAMTQAATTTQLSLKANDADVVHLTGDETIAGQKTFNNTVYVKNINYAYNETPSSNSFTSLYIRDKNDRIIGAFELAKLPDGTNCVRLNVQGKNGSWASSPLGLGANSSGVSYTFCPASDVNGSIVTTVNKSKGNNGYFKLGNGLIIQWGTLSSGKTITYSTAFTNANSYALVFNNNAGTDGYGRADQVASKTSTSATVNGLCENPIRWLAIGY